MVYTQTWNPTHHLWLSALLAFLPLLTLLVLLGGLKIKAHWSSLAALAVAVVVAVAAYDMPVFTVLNSGLYGAFRGVLLVLWITFNAIWIYNMTVDTGHFAVLRRAFARISDDQRVQAIVIAFSFGALIEALAGGGSPVAICTVMLVAIGFNPLKAVAVALVADTAVGIKGRVNWREDKMSVFGSDVIPLDISDAEFNPGTTPPFVIRADATKLDREAVLELRSTLMAHKGDTPVHILMGHQDGEMALTVDDYKVKVSAALIGELKGIAGITVAAG